ncbi:SDR family NAD(P)-dependent oxidoreductase [Sphingomonas sp. C3-2]|uniref:SDR family NAD(P)-dependent oxidoreductase n=1 Tax=Sphingomonas sp. C3-2 TaxID=3062169 RepID=UPI00294B8523|nr:SDR family NAD(P)-dependent oxidoreductase [Sphingomonas sp. C3-2]WOK35741.1 SDR family NAD(P)-dependent oxidoreductase [Sphingomonas sp. C3-2]
MMRSLDFTGKTVLVTGGGAGIGRAIAEAFGANGAKVAIAEIDADRCAAVDAALKEKGVDALVIEADVRDRAAVDALMPKIEARFGGLDILVNNVGDSLGIHGPFEFNSDEQLDGLYATNLRSMFLVTRAAIPLIRKRGPGGSIINISSIEAFRAIPVCTVYSAFKHAITGFTRSLSLELGPEGIRVNAIAPETTETEQVRPSVLIAEEHRHHVDRWIPLGRFGEPEDAAGCALFLASDLSGWVTGTTINLDGGALAAAGWYRDPNQFWTNVPVVTGNGFNF